VKKEGGRPPTGGFVVLSGRFFDSSKLERKRPFLLALPATNRPALESPGQLGGSPRGD